MTLDLLAWAPSDRVSVARENRHRPTIDERFAQFHAANPHVFARMLSIAQQQRASGVRRISAKALWEQLRATLSLESGTRYKLDNSLVSRYADLLLEADPGLSQLIETRRRRGT